MIFNPSIPCRTFPMPANVDTVQARMQDFLPGGAKKIWLFLLIGLYESVVGLTLELLNISIESRLFSYMGIYSKLVNIYNTNKNNTTHSGSSDETVTVILYVLRSSQFLLRTSKFQNNGRWIRGWAGLVRGRGRAHGIGGFTNSNEVGNKLVQRKALYKSLRL